MQRGTRVREHACAREWDVRCGVVYDVADAKLAGSARERDRDVPPGVRGTVAVVGSVAGGAGAGRWFPGGQWRGLRGRGRKKATFSCIVDFSTFHCFRRAFGFACFTA